MPKQIPQIPRQALLAMMIGRKQYLSRRRRERWRERHRSLPAVNSASYANSTYYNDVYRQFRRNSLVSSHLTHNRSQGPHNHMEQPHSNYHQGGCCTHIWFTSRQLSMKAPDPSAWSLRPAWTSNIGTHTHTHVCQIFSIAPGYEAVCIGQRNVFFSKIKDSLRTQTVWANGLYQISSPSHESWQIYNSSKFPTSKHHHWYRKNKWNTRQVDQGYKKATGPFKEW